MTSPPGKYITSHPKTGSSTKVYTDCLYRERETIFLVSIDTWCECEIYGVEG